MLKFITKVPTQRGNEVNIFSESIGFKETIDDMKAVFSDFADKLRCVMRKGLVVVMKRITFHFSFVGDFKVVYALTSSFGASSRFPCPWCKVTGTMMDQTRS